MGLHALYELDVTSLFWLHHLYNSYVPLVVSLSGALSSQTGSLLEMCFLMLLGAIYIQGRFILLQLNSISRLIIAGSIV
jgi:hypothetical protein